MTREQCYGNLFPSMTSPRTDMTVKGKAFSVELRRAGGMMIASRRAAVDLEQWQKCLDCEAFDACYKLSTAKLALETAAVACTG
jgi:hypothetical protein